MTKAVRGTDLHSHPRSEDLDQRNTFTGTVGHEYKVACDYMPWLVLFNEIVTCTHIYNDIVLYMYITVCIFWSEQICQYMLYMVVDCRVPDL